MGGRCVHAVCCVAYDVSPPHFYYTLAHPHMHIPSPRLQYLSNADERLKWQANALPSDDLCTENAIMIKRFNRYPLIIDPSGQATEFIMNEYRDRKITRTRYVCECV